MTVRFCLAGGHKDPTPREIEDALSEAQHRAALSGQTVQVCQHDGTGAAEVAAWVFPDRTINLTFLGSQYA